MKVIETKVTTLFTYWNKKTIFTKIHMIFDFENLFFAILERPEGVGRSFYHKTIWLQVI